MLVTRSQVEVLAGNFGAVVFGADSIHVAPSRGAPGENLRYGRVVSAESDSSGRRFVLLSALGRGVLVMIALYIFLVVVLAMRGFGSDGAGIASFVFGFWPGFFVGWWSNCVSFSRCFDGGR